jgi:DNA-binding MarR family transcriptional regulator
MSQFNILMQLHHKGACGVSDISERFDITSAAASQLVDKLVQSGLLDRAEDPSDRRAKQITLSAKGRDLIEKSITARFRWVDELTRDLSAEEMKKVGEALDVLTNATKRIENREQRIEKRNLCKHP